MRDLLASQRYAQALFHVVVAQQMDAEANAELEAFSAALKGSQELQKFFDNPKFNLEDKRKFLTRIYQGKNHPVYLILVNFFSLLLEKNRFRLIHEITAAYKKIADEFQGESTAEIRTAVPMSHDFETAIISRLEKMAGYKITVQKVVDPDLLGGVLVRFKNKVIDGSVRHQIDLIKKALTKIKTI